MTWFPVARRRRTAIIISQFPRQLKLSDVPIDDEVLVRYLRGELDGAGRSAIEEALFQDDAILDRLLALSETQPRPSPASNETEEHLEFETRLREFLKRRRPPGLRHRH